MSPSRPLRWGVFGSLRFISTCPRLSGVVTIPMTSINMSLSLEEHPEVPALE